MRGVSCLERSVPVGEHTANGAVESAIREVKRRIRTLHSVASSLHQIKIG